MTATFDIAERPSLDSHYENEGDDALYNGESAKIIILDHNATVGDVHNSTAIGEGITFLIRRYGTGGVINPKIGDKLILSGESGVEEKKFNNSFHSVNHETANEFELTFLRSSTIRKGSTTVRPYGES